MRDRVGEVIQFITHTRGCDYISLSSAHRPVDQQRPANNVCLRHESPVSAVVTVVPVVSHHKIISLRNDELTILDQFAEQYPPLRSLAWCYIQAWEIVTEQIAARPAEVCVRFSQRRSIDEHLPIHQPDTISRHANYALHKVLRRVHRIMKHHNVAAMNATVGHHVVREAATSIAEFIDQQVIANQQRILHGGRRNLERLHHECNHKYSNDDCSEE